MNVFLFDQYYENMHEYRIRQLKNELAVEVKWEI